MPHDDGYFSLVAGCDADDDITWIEFNNMSHFCGGKWCDPFRTEIRPFPISIPLRLCATQRVNIVSNNCWSDEFKISIDISFECDQINLTVALGFMLAEEIVPYLLRKQPKNGIIVYEKRAHGQRTNGDNDEPSLYHVFLESGRHLDVFV